MAEEQKGSNTRAEGQRKNTSLQMTTIILGVLLTISNTTGSGLFALGIAIVGAGSGTCLLLVIAIGTISTTCEALTTVLKEVYCQKSYLDLVEAMTSPPCAKIVCFAFFLSQAASQGALLATIAWKFDQLAQALGLVKDDWANPGHSYTIFYVVACSLVALAELSIHVLRSRRGQHFNVRSSTTINVVSSNIGVLNSGGEAPTADCYCADAGRQKMSFGKRRVGIIMLVFAHILLLVSYAYREIQIIFSTGVTRHRTNSGRLGWYTMPILVFATSSFSFILPNIENMLQREYASDSDNSGLEITIVQDVERMLAMGFFTELLLLISAMAMAYQPGRFEDTALINTEIVLCTAAILICVSAASIRLRPCARVCKKMLPKSALTAAKWDSFMYGLLFTVSCCLGYLARYPERIIALSGCTLWPFLLWFVPNALHLWHARKEERKLRKYVRISVHLTILLAILVFCILHVTGLRSSPSPLAYAVIYLNRYHP